MFLQDLLWEKSFCDGGGRKMEILRMKVSVVNMHAIFELCTEGRPFIDSVYNCLCA